MSSKFLKAIALLLILLALGCVAGAFLAASKRTDIQGPSALAVLSDQSVWVSVEDTMWHLDASGKRLAVVDAATLGVGGLIGKLMVHPNGQLAAQVRNDPTIYFLDPETAIIKSRLLPQWPPGFGNHVSNAINYAFHQDGRVAIATGGGHAVAVFDEAGRFLGRTKPGTYEFTNGLWWSADSLWTTDTNRQQLVELDGNTLTEKSRVQLNLNCGGWQFLGMATPSHGEASDKTKTQPLVTLVRFANGMIKGRASDIFSDGSQLDYPISGRIPGQITGSTTGAPEPRDINWRGSELLMVDGASYSIKRYSNSRVPMDVFGDAQVQAELTAMLDRRNSLEKQYWAYLVVAVALFLIGFAFVLRAQALEKTQTLAAMNVDLSQLGSPILSASARFVASVKIAWPSILIMCACIVSLLYFQKLAAARPTSPQALLVVLILNLLLILLASILVRRNLKRNAINPDSEAIFNRRAIQFLQTEASFWRLRQPDELPQETLILAPGGWLNWLVLTNQRLLVFAVNLRDRTLTHEYPRSNISGLRILEAREMTWLRKLQMLLSVVGAVIRIEFKNGTSLTGYTISTQTARRMAMQLKTTTLDNPVTSSMTRAQFAQAKTRSITTQNQNAHRQAIASFLIPGLGQWIQRRSGTAFFFFVAWLLVLMSVIPVAWTWWETLAAVPLRMIIFTASSYLFVCTLAAWDAWRIRER